MEILTKFTTFQMQTTQKCMTKYIILSIILSYIIKGQRPELLPHHATPVHRGNTAQLGSWLVSAMAVAVASPTSKAAQRSSRLASGWRVQRWWWEPFLPMLQAGKDGGVSDCGLQERCLTISLGLSPKGGGVEWGEGEIRPKLVG